jgi:hypothetical protein
MVTQFWLMSFHRAHSATILFITAVFAPLTTEMAVLVNFKLLIHPAIAATLPSRQTSD